MRSLRHGGEGRDCGRGGTQGHGAKCSPTTAGWIRPLGGDISPDMSRSTHYCGWQRTSGRRRAGPAPAGQSRTRVGVDADLCSSRALAARSAAALPAIRQSAGLWHGYGMLVAAVAALSACAPAGAAAPRLDADAPSLLWFAARNATEFDRVCDCSRQGPVVFAAIAQDREAGDQVRGERLACPGPRRIVALTRCCAPVLRPPGGIGHTPGRRHAGGGISVAGGGAHAAGRRRLPRRPPRAGRRP